MKCYSRFAVVALAVSLFAGCSRQSPSTPSSWAHPVITNFGVVDLTNGVPVRRDMGNSNVCVITPTLLADGSIQLNMTIERNGKKLSTPTVTTLPDRAVEVSVGDVGVGLTPRIKH